MDAFPFLSHLSRFQNLNSSADWHVSHIQHEEPVPHNWYPSQGGFAGARYSERFIPSRTYISTDQQGLGNTVNYLV